MKKCFAYLRVSGRGQIEGSGFDRQLTTIKKYCSASGYEIEKTYKEQVSGTKDENSRPVFMEMIAAILDNGVRTIIVESLDRLAREVRVQEQLLIFLCAKGITLISANTGENVTEAISADPMRKALIQMQAVFSELEKSTIVNRLQRGQAKLRQTTGRCGAPLPYGQDPNKPEEKEILHKIAYLRRKSKGQVKRTSFRGVADELNKLGHRTRTGLLWTAQHVYHVYMVRGGK